MIAMYTDCLDLGVVFAPPCFTRGGNSGYIPLAKEHGDRLKVLLTPWYLLSGLPMEISM